MRLDAQRPVLHRRQQRPDRGSAAGHHLPGADHRRVHRPGGVLKSNPGITAFLAAVSATHGCEPAPTLTNNAPAVFPMGTTGVKFTATDPDWLGSSADCTANVHVVDTTPPSISCPLAITVECTASGGTPKTDPAIAAFLAGASATDVCDPSPTLSNNAPAFFPDGTTHITFTAKDADNNASTCVADVHVVDTTPPSIICPKPITVECNDHCLGGGVPDTDPAIVAFLAGASATDVCDPAPVITDNHPACFQLGDNLVTFTATDASTNHASCSVNVKIVDTTPPVITVALDRTVLWPPNHKMSDINAAVTVTDVCDPHPTFVLTSITSNEPINGLGDGDTAPDWANADTGTPDVAFQLRSERSGKGTGRKYTIVYTASDASGNTATAQVCVFVPHDMAGGALAADGLSPDGTGFEDAANWFALVVPSIDPSTSGNDVLLEGGTDAGAIAMGDGTLAPRIRSLFAGDIDAANVFVGNFKGALSPFRVRLTDVNGDGLNDAVYYYRVADVKALRAASALDDGPVGLHFQLSPTVSFLVADIFALGAPVKLPADVSSVPVDHNPIDARAGTTGGAEGVTAKDPATDPATVRALPSLTRFSGVYPNPFDAGTTLAFDLAADHQVRLAVYDLRGALVRTLRSGWLPAGRYNVAWDGRDRDGRAVPGGVYLVRFDAGGKSFTRKAVLMK